MTTPNAATPAFPWHQSPGNQDNLGLSKREWFAGMAIQGLLAGVPEGMRAETIPTSTIRVWASFSCKCADAMLAELEKKP